MTTITGYAFDCYGAAVWGWSQYKYVEFDVVDLSTMLPVGVRPRQSWCLSNGNVVNMW